MVEEQTGTEMLFEEQEKKSETQEIILGDPEGNLPKESNLDRTASSQGRCSEEILSAA